MNYNVYNIELQNTQQPIYNLLPNQNYCYQNKYNISNTSIDGNRNRFVYINQNFVHIDGVKRTKVLINPNFKQTVHINPNFKSSIHVNPNILKINETASVIQPIIQNNSEKNINIKNNAKTVPIIATRTKLVRGTNAKQPNIDPAKCERRKSLHTKYKIVHNAISSSKIDYNSNNYLKNRYKIDKNITKIRRPSKNNVVQSKYQLQNNSVYINNKCLKKRKLNSKYISINGTLYKKTPNVLKKADLVKIATGKESINKSKVLLIRDKLYKLDNHHKTLKIIPISKSTQICKSRNASNKMLKQQKINTPIKLNRSKRRIISRNTKDMSKCILISKMKKCNMPCPIYRKFGRCRAKKCIKVHNPDQVMMCMKFLQGDCFKSNCLLSHKVSAEKMPACKYYLDGLCTREDCMYLHVKISAKADICKDFLEGFCKKAKECDKRHQFLCPDYDKNGTCPRKRCHYPHGNVVRNKKILNKVAKRIVRVRSKSTTVLKIKAVKDGHDEQLDKYLRYYKENEGMEIKNIIQDNVNNHTDETDLVGIKHLNLKLLKRAQVGSLPSFIPLGHEVVCSVKNDVKV